jgi:hypothetical protein
LAGIAATVLGSRLPIPAAAMLREPRVAEAAHIYGLRSATSAFPELSADANGKNNSAEDQNGLGPHAA